MSELLTNQLRRIDDATMAPVKEVFDRFVQSSTLMCWGYAKAAGHYHLELYRQKRTFVSFSQTGVTLEDAWLRLGRVVINMRALHNQSAFKCQHNCNACGETGQKLISAVENLIANSRASVPGLCLECERAGALKIGQICGHKIDK